MSTTLFDIELRGVSASFIPSEALLIYLLGIIPFSGFGVVGLILAFIGLVAAYIFIAYMPILKWVYLIIMWLLSWAFITGVFGAIVQFITQTKEISLTVSIISVLVGAIGAFLFGLIRGASFRYYTEELF